MHERRPTRIPDGFTLAELLVVLAIVGILFAIALPALTSITGQSKLGAAANAVHSAAKLARQHAIAHNQPTYLVFHDDQSTADPNLAYRAYAVFTINIHTNPIDQSAGHFLTGWETLPAGVVFDPVSNIRSNLFDIGTESWQGGLNRNNELRIGSSTYIVFGFKPSGEAASATHHILVAEGTVANGQPTVFSPGQGKLIHFSTIGTSKIMDSVYGEDGEFNLVGE